MCLVHKAYGKMKDEIAFEADRLNSSGAFNVEFAVEIDISSSTQGQQNRETRGGNAARAVRLIRLHVHPRISNAAAVPLPAFEQLGLNRPTVSQGVQPLDNPPGGVDRRTASVQMQTFYYGEVEDGPSETRVTNPYADSMSATQPPIAGATVTRNPALAMPASPAQKGPHGRGTQAAAWSPT